MINSQNLKKADLVTLLNKFGELFDGSLGELKTEPIQLELKPDAKPHHAKPYPVPHSQEEKLKAEVEFLCKLKVSRSAIILNGQHQCLLFLNQMEL